LLNDQLTEPNVLRHNYTELVGIGIPHMFKFWPRSIKNKLYLASSPLKGLHVKKAIGFLIAIRKVCPHSRLICNHYSIYRRECVQQARGCTGRRYFRALHNTTLPAISNGCRFLCTVHKSDAYTGNSRIPHFGMLRQSKSSLTHWNKSFKTFSRSWVISSKLSCSRAANMKPEIMVGSMNFFERLFSFWRIGRFLSGVLNDLYKWHQEEPTYIQDNRSKVGGKTVQHTGFQGRYLYPMPADNFLKWPQYMRVVRKWYKKLANVRIYCGSLKWSFVHVLLQAFTECIQTGEFMHVYNAIIVLKEILPVFPVATVGAECGPQLDKAMDQFLEKEERGDLKILGKAWVLKMSICARTC